MFGIIIILLLKISINEVYGLTTFKIPNKYDMIKEKTQHDYYGNINFNIEDNNNKNFCVNCKYYLPFIYSESNHRTKFAKCNKFILPDIKKEQDAMSCVYPNNNNKAIFDYFEFCKDCRKDKNKCGIEGKYFEEKMSV